MQAPALLIHRTESLSGSSSSLTAVTVRSGQSHRSSDTTSLPSRPLRITNWFGTCLPAGSGQKNASNNLGDSRTLFEGERRDNASPGVLDGHHDEGDIMANGRTEMGRHIAISSSGEQFTVCEIMRIEPPWFANENVANRIEPDWETASGLEVFKESDAVFQVKRNHEWIKVWVIDQPAETDSQATSQ